MNIISKIQSTQTIITGRLSDGSDRNEIKITIYTVQIKDSTRTLQMIFDHDPLDEDISTRYNNNDFTDVTSDKDLIVNLQQLLNILPPVANPITLQDYQRNKIYELNTACNQTILDGFSSSCTGTEHEYKFDMEYQGNITQQGVMLTLDPTIAVVPWPTKDAGVIPHSREQFIQLCKDAQDWKGTNIYRYFGMKAQVEACTEIADVGTFVW